MLTFLHKLYFVAYLRASMFVMYLRTCAPSEDSDQTAHSRSLIRIFTGRISDSRWQGYKVSSCGQRRLIRLRVWSESSLGAYVVRHVFSRCGSYLLRLRWGGLRYAHFYKKLPFRVRINNMLIGKHDKDLTSLITPACSLLFLLVNEYLREI